MLRLCLKSIRSTIDKQLSYEVIVVDSFTQSKNKLIIKNEFPEVNFYPFKKNLGYSRGVNMGIFKSKGKYVLVLNPDIIVKQGSVETMLAYLKKHEDVGMIGPKMMNFNGTYQNTYFRFYKPLTILVRRSFFGKLPIFKKIENDFLMNDTNPNKIQTPDWIMGSAMMIPRAAIKKVGLMDERFFMYFEAVDWCRRFWHNGYKVVYLPAAVMYHYHQRESKSKWGILDPLFNKKTRWHLISAIKYFLKYEA